MGLQGETPTTAPWKNRANGDCNFSTTSVSISDIRVRRDLAVRPSREECASRLASDPNLSSENGNFQNCHQTGNVSTMTKTSAVITRSAAQRRKLTIVRHALRGAQIFQFLLEHLVYAFPRNLWENPPVAHSRSILTQRR